MAERNPSLPHKDYPARIIDITEADFWGTLKPLPGRGDQTLLAKAVALGKGGKKSAAYKALAAYHAASLRAEYQALQDGDLPINFHAKRQTVAELFEHKLWLRNRAYQYGRKIDWNKPVVDHALYWILPLFYDYLAKPTEKYAAKLRFFMVEYYKARNTFKWPFAHYHPAYTALSGSLKLRHILPIYIALACNRALTPAATEAWLKLMLGISRALHRRETDFVLSNQTVTNVAAYGYLGAVMPEFKESAAWRKRALERIAENLETGFLPDGGYYERSYAYSGVALRDAAQGIRRIARNYPLPEGYRERIAKVALRANQFYAKTLAPGDFEPGIADGSYHHAPGIMHLADDFLPAGTPPDFGVDRLASWHLPDSGFAVLRALRGERYGLFSHGRSDLWHCHMDLLNLDVWAFGHPFLIEASRFGSYSEPMDRLLRMPEMHNTVAVDGQVYDESSGANLQCRNVVFGETAEFVWTGAEHGAYRKRGLLVPQEQNYLTRRTVVLLKKHGIFVVLDAVVPAGGGAAGVISQYWHSPYPIEVEKTGEAVIRHAGCGVVMATPQLAELRRRETRLVYGAAESSFGTTFPERHQLRLQLWGEANDAGAVGCITAIVPFKGKRPIVKIERVRPPAAGRQYQDEVIAMACGTIRLRLAFQPGKAPWIL